MLCWGLGQDTSLPVPVPGGNEGGAQFKEEKNLRSPAKKPAVLPMKNLGLEHPACAEEPSTSAVSKEEVKMEESEEDYAFDEPPLKKLKSSMHPQGNRVKNAACSAADEDQKMNWNIVQVQDRFPFHNDSLCLNSGRKFAE